MMNAAKTGPVSRFNFRSHGDGIIITYQLEELLIQLE